MNFDANEDLSIFFDAIDRLAAHHRAWTPGTHRYEHAIQLEAELEDGGFFGCATEPSLGLVAATAMVHTLSQLPACAEIAASALVGPLVCPELPRPLALIWDDAGRPTRFLPTARAVLRVDAQGAAWVAKLHNDDVISVESSFAYPMGTLRRPEALDWQVLPSGAADPIGRLWRLGLAAELGGCLQAGVDAVVAHVTERRQFGRPLGSFQGVQHRLAAAASAIQGARWLALKAARTQSNADAAIAAGYVQSMSTRIVYDLHQFMGAMGLTLEHPLHRWTYRAKLLRSELGGASQQFQQVAALLWDAA